MATRNENAQSAVVARLDFLLQRARIVKSSTSIDPSLEVAKLVPEDELLVGAIEGEKEARLLAVDSAARNLFYANLVCFATVIRKACAYTFRDRHGSTSQHL